MLPASETGTPKPRLRKLLEIEANAGK
jgi:hypothetical protein